MNLKCFTIMQFDGEYQDRIFQKLQEAVNRFSKTTDHSVVITRADLTPPLKTTLEEHLAEHIERCDIVLAEISQLNPNVLFEMGYAIALRKPVIILVQTGTRVPADFRGRLYFEYTIDDLDVLPQTLQGYLFGAVDTLLAARFRQTYQVQAFARRDLADLGSRLTLASQRIEILTTNLFSLVKNDHVETIAERCKKSPALGVRILTLDPESDFAAHRARQVGISTRHFRDELRGSLEQVSKILKNYPEQCRLATYNEFPTQITVRIDDLVYFHVVSANHQSRNNISLKFNELNAGVSESILSHFDTVWGRGSTHHRT